MVALSALLLGGCASKEPDLPDDTAAVAHWEYQGGWLAPRSGHPLDSAAGTMALEEMRALGVRYVAVGQDVHMPKVKEPHLVWGEADGALRGFLCRARAAGLETFLLPRIESPDFFQPPYPFRGDIRFASDERWERFHSAMEKMILHYARLAQEEGVALFGLGLELKHSVLEHPERWRRIIAKVRKVYAGKITYSANWYEEWEHVTFWDALDLIGVGAYFELKPGGQDPARPGAASWQDLVERWRPIRERLRRVSSRYDRPVLFTEVGYTGYRDCAERPWEWAGKQEKGVPIDHDAQVRALTALFEVVRGEACLAGLFVWSFYTNPGDIEAWEYAVQGRPSAAVVRWAYAPYGKMKRGR